MKVYIYSKLLGKYLLLVSRSVRIIERCKRVLVFFLQNVTTVKLLVVEDVKCQGSIDFGAHMDVNN